MVEIVDEQGRPAAPGEMGRVLVTTLQNHLMPLVRYEIGDYAVAAGNRCSCGRTLPTLDRIVGRGVNLFQLKGGRLLSPWLLMEAVRDRIEMRQFQIVQKTIDWFLVRVVADRPPSLSEQALIRTDFAKLIGTNVQVTFERVAEIARTRSGKFMTTLSELTDADQ
jgi:phenylacetate-CoA ligase